MPDMDLHVYGFQNADGSEYAGACDTLDYQEAKEFAELHKVRVIEYTYQYADCEMIEDFSNA